MWHTPLLLSMLDPENPAKELLQLLNNVILEKSCIVVGMSPEG